MISITYICIAIFLIAIAFEFGKYIQRSESNQKTYQKLLNDYQRLKEEYELMKIKNEKIYDEFRKVTQIVTDEIEAKTKNKKDK